MSARIFIAIPVHNRRAIVEQCVPTVIAGMTQEDQLVIYDDGSTEWDREMWIPGGKMVNGWIPSTFRSAIYNLEITPVGIERQRRRHFMDFAQRATPFTVTGRGADFLHESVGGFTHLYLTDSDAIHDPNWRHELLRLQKLHDAPICGYNTEAHARLPGNTIMDDPQQEVLWRKVAPGISYLLTREHVRKVVDAIAHIPDPLHWDWTVPSILGNRFAITRRSVVDHIGHGGMHHPEAEGYEGGDRCTSPTDWLVAKRAEIVEKLKRGAVA